MIYYYYPQEFYYKRKVTMYFSFGPVNKDDDFSWIICKNPDSENFVRKINNGLTINGYYITEQVLGKDSYDRLKYVIEIDIDPLTFLEESKKRNSCSYVHPHLGGVTPVSLSGVFETLRSAIKGKNSSGGKLTDIDIHKKKKMEAIIGPFINKQESVINLFSNLGIRADISHVVEYDPSEAFVYVLETISDMSVCEFLQKIYMGSYYLTSNLTITKLNEEIISKFVSLCSSWIEEHDYIKNSFIGRFTKGHFKFKSQMKEELTKEPEQELDDEAKEIRTGIHEKRHSFVVDTINNLEIDRVIDLGCSEGRLGWKIKRNATKKIKYLGLDINQLKIKKCFGLKDPNFKFKNTDIISPNIDDEELKPDLLTCIEVIEHLDFENRQLLLESIKTIYCPKYIILTTPNYEYNKNFAGILKNGYGSLKYRHPDHKIEYTRSQFEDEVVSSLSTLYNIEDIYLTDNKDEQITFCIFCSHKDVKNRKINTKLLNQIKEKYNKIYLPFSNYTIRKNEIANGYGSKQLDSMYSNIFYTPPTISPVDYDPEYPDYLEHPMSCIKYYKDRGINKLVMEYKYMGSRSNILAFRNCEQAKLFGFNHSITVLSRNGFRFFDKLDKPEKEYLNSIDEDLKRFWSNTDKEFIILDAEILPWSLKAKQLIRKSFLAPAECTYLSRLYRNKNTESCEKFLKSLSNYSNESELEIYPFHVLAEGYIDGSKFSNYTTGFNISNVEHMEYSKLLKNKIFKECKYTIVDLNNKSHIDEAIKVWNYYSEKGGEGMVFKPIEFFSFTRDDHPVQPAIKVRGREYLRIIYGIDYLDKDYFEILTKRNIRMKRLQAIQEHELSRYVLNSFLRRDRFMHQKYLAAFIGMENVNFGNIDATL